MSYKHAMQLLVGGTNWEILYKQIGEFIFGASFCTSVCFWLMEEYFKLFPCESESLFCFVVLVKSQVGAVNAIKWHKAKAATLSILESFYFAWADFSKLRKEVVEILLRHLWGQTSNKQISLFIEVLFFLLKRNAEETTIKVIIVHFLHGLLAFSLSSERYKTVVLGLLSDVVDTYYGADRFVTLCFE